MARYWNDSDTVKLQTLQRSLEQAACIRVSVYVPQFGGSLDMAELDGAIRCESRWVVRLGAEENHGSDTTEYEGPVHKLPTRAASCRLCR